MHIRLFTQARAGAIAGGRVYATRMIAALRDAGSDAEELPLPGDALSAAMRDAARAGWENLPPGVTVLIDTTVLPAFASLADAVLARGAVPLMHHPAALESGLDAASHAELSHAEKALLALLPRVVVASEALAARLVEQFSIPRTRIVVVPPGSDPAPRAAGSGGPSCAILSVGALVPRKGHDVLLHALARLTDLDWRLDIVGRDDAHPVHAASLRALAEELGIAQRVTFHGWLSPERLAEMWHGTDLFALATRWEAHGATVAEALRRGVPVAVTNGGAAAALVSMENGVVVQTGDAEMLGKSLRRVIFDADLRAGLAEAAWRAGQELPDWPAQAARLRAALSA